MNADPVLAADTARTASPSETDRGHIVCEGLVKIYSVGDREVLALQGLELHVDAGELLAIVGASGSGKSTLLNILAALDTPSAGQARVGGHDLTRMTAADRIRYRRDVIGFVWQQTTRNLLPYLSAADNIELPMRLAGLRRSVRKERLAELAELVGLTAALPRRPAALSGGEQQRTAVAVALANRPQVLLADEPTGELDTEASEQLFAAFRRANEHLGVTFVVLTHDPLVSDQVERTVQIRDGRTAHETLRQRAHTTDSHEVIAQDFAVLDSVGRLQLPRDYVDALGLRRRVRVELEPDHIGIWPDQRLRPARPAPGSREED